MSLLQFTDRGIYCPPGDFYIDPWLPCERAVITHAHSDHARWGMKSYLSTPLTGEVMKHRLGQSIILETLDYGIKQHIHGVSVSFHPAGHIPGSAQVRVEYKGEVWVAAGDYKTHVDGVSAPFESVKCHGFITESTFGLPVYHWKENQEILKEINDWWRNNASLNVTSILFCYALGKAQRVIQGLENIGPVYCHGAVENTNEVLRNAGLMIGSTELLTRDVRNEELSKALVIAPPSADSDAWLKKFKDVSTAAASGWMALRGTRRRRNLDRGFVMSDHADWNGLLSAIKSSEAEKVAVTHGYAPIFAKYLNEIGIQATAESTAFEGETIDKNTEEVA